MGKNLPLLFWLPGQTGEGETSSVLEKIFKRVSPNPKVFSSWLTLSRTQKCREHRSKNEPERFLMGKFKGQCRKDMPAAKIDAQEPCNNTSPVTQNLHEDSLSVVRTGDPHTVCANRKSCLNICIYMIILYTSPTGNYDSIAGKAWTSQSCRPTWKSA